MKAIVFDWDGTIMDNFELMFEVLTRQILQGGGMPPTIPDFLSNYVPPHMEYLAKHGSTLSEEVAWKVWLQVPSRVMPYDGAHTLFEHVQALKIPCYIATANQKARVEAQLTEFGLHHYFTELYSDQEHKYQSLEMVCELNHAVDRKDVWYVGDMRTDMESAIKAGVTGIGIASSQCKEVHMSVLKDAGAVQTFSTLADFHASLLQ
jgi:phosphoglycolate phosphatase-like HAD superfamily hydrolase